MDQMALGRQIVMLRKRKGITQSELGQRLGVSFQAVSKWERGETLPDIGILVDLADVLETSVDQILRGDQCAVQYRGRISAEQIRDGILSLKRMGDLLGTEHLLYRSAVEGINSKLNTDIEAAFYDTMAFDAFLAEAIIQALVSGKYIDVTDVKNCFQYDHFRDIVLSYCARYGIK